MARKRKNELGNGQLVLGEQPERRHVQPNSVRFHNVSFNDVDQQWLAAELVNASAHLDDLYSWVADEQLRIGVSFDAKSNRWNATCTSWVVGDSRYGVILSVRAKSPALALFALAYATGFKLAEGWGDSLEQDAGLFG